MKSGIVSGLGFCDECGESLYVSYLVLGATYAVEVNGVITRNLCAICGRKHELSLPGRGALDREK